MYLTDTLLCICEYTHIDQASTHTSTHIIFIRCLLVSVVFIIRSVVESPQTGRSDATFDSDANFSIPIRIPHYSIRNALNFIWRLASRP